MVAIILVAGCASPADSRIYPTPSIGGWPTESIAPSASASPVCDPRGGTCLGDIAPGTYTSTTFRPRFTYTVPGGWSNTMDLPTNFLLARTDDPVVDFYGGNAINLVPNVAAASQNCEQTPEPGVGRTAQAISDWLVGLAAVQSSGPRPTTVGGLTGFVVDAQLTPTWTRSCPFGEGALIQMTVAGDPAEFRRHSAILAVGVSVRLYVLDRPGGGNVMVLVVDIPDEISFADYLMAATPVVESMQFGS